MLCYVKRKEYLLVNFKITFYNKIEKMRGVNMNDLAKNLKYYRIQKGMSQESLAAKIFVTRQTISNYENGKSEPNLDTISKLAEVLEVRQEDLLNISEKTKWDIKLLIGFGICIIFWFLLLYGYIQLNVWTMETYNYTARLAMTAIQPYGYILLIILTCCLGIELIRKKYRLSIEFFQNKIVRYTIYALFIIFVFSSIIFLTLAIYNVFDYWSWEKANPMGGTYSPVLNTFWLIYPVIWFHDIPILYFIPALLGCTFPFSKKEKII